MYESAQPYRCADALASGSLSSICFRDRPMWTKRRVHWSSRHLSLATLTPMTQSLPHYFGVMERVSSWEGYLWGCEAAYQPLYRHPDSMYMMHFSAIRRERMHAAAHQPGCC